MRVYSRDEGQDSVSEEHLGLERVGELFQETEGTEARYTFRGDELYVRAEVVSSAPMARPTEESSPNKAWLPPVAP